MHVPCCGRETEQAASIKHSFSRCLCKLCPKFWSHWVLDETCRAVVHQFMWDIRSFEAPETYHSHSLHSNFNKSVATMLNGRSHNLQGGFLSFWRRHKFGPRTFVSDGALLEILHLICYNYFLDNCIGSIVCICTDIVACSVQSGVIDLFFSSRLASLP